MNKDEKISLAILATLMTIGALCGIAGLVLHFLA